jgi:hypothetical protein
MVLGQQELAAPLTGATDIVFARTRHQYDSYIDFWSLVELSEFSTCFIDEIRIDEAKCFIFTPWNGEVDPHLQAELSSGRDKKATLAWWCLERFDGMPVPYQDALEQAAAFVDEMWVSDRWISSFDERLKYVPLGSHPGLGNPRLDPVYDFTHQSYAWGRRQSMYNTLRGMGLREGPSTWGDERDAVLRRSRLVLNLQQYPDPVTAPLRFALAAAYGLPAVSETIKDPHPLEGIVSCADYDEIPALVRAVLAHGGEKMAEDLHARLCVELTFRKGVEGAV